MNNSFVQEDNRHNLKIAYVHTMTFPSTEANAFDAIWTASALSQKVSTTFFVPRLLVSKSQLKKHYNVCDTPLQIQPLYFNYVPDRLLMGFPEYYSQALAFYFRHHPSWARFHGQKILYIRHPKALLYWGLQRETQKWLKDWILLYESHDPLGLDPRYFQAGNPFDLKEGPERDYTQKVLHAARNFDLILCNTQAQADDLKTWSNDALQPHFVAIASPLPRLEDSPRIRPFGQKIILGYIGTIDQYRGVHILLEAMRYLPANFVLRIVGRFRQEKDVDPAWFDRYLADPQIGPHVELKPPVPILEVVGEIDQCDIVIQPASADILDSRYATPQKSFDYMARGKPIIAGDVYCHRELFQNGKTAVLYALDPRSFAERVIALVKNQALAEQIACSAWEQSAYYTPARRSDEILSLVESYMENI
jgi:glycosyltransferase involved in cell wall biosynthesis